MAAEHNDVFHHIRDFPYLELPNFLGGKTDDMWTFPFGQSFEFQLTKFMVLQVVAGLLTLFIFMGLSWHIRSGRAARGGFWNFWEMLALYIRDNVARPAIGEGHHHDHDHHDDAHHDEHHGTEHQGTEPGHAHAVKAAVGHPADKYLPYIWSCFFYVLFCNLLGAIPWLGSPTGSLSVTGALAFVTLIFVVVSGSVELGPGKFWKSLVPSMELPGAMATVLIPMIWVIELLGLMIKHGVLAVRLFANIMAGHTVIAVILGFIAETAHPSIAADYPWLFWVVMPASILGQVAIGLLELFVAFLQAYIFAFLSALFIGAAVHPH